MIHEVKIPAGCKASVSVDNEKIVVLIDPVDDFVKIDEDTDSIGKEIVVPKIEFNVDSNFQKQMNSNITLTEYDANKLYGVLCDEDNRILSKVHPGMVVKSETGHIALVGSSDYTVVLTPDKEIQLNQTCNFPFEYHATKEESEELFEQLKIQKALQVSCAGVLTMWVPKLGETYASINSIFEMAPMVFKCNKHDNLLFLADNMFPVGFITEERQQQLKETLKNLFDSWRK